MIVQICVAQIPLSVTVPGGFLRFLETGQPSHQARQLTIPSKAAGVVTATGTRMNKTNLVRACARALVTTFTMDIVFLSYKTDKVEVKQLIMEQKTT